MKDFILCAGIGIIIYFLIIFPIHNWNCERFGMKADYFVSGCVIKGD